MTGDPKEMVQQVKTLLDAEYISAASARGYLGLDPGIDSSTGISINYSASQEQSLKANAKVESFFNTVKLPYLMNGMENDDFKVTVSRLGSTPKGDQYEFELSVQDPNLNVKDTIARAIVHWDNPEDSNTQILVSEVVFDHDVEAVCKLHPSQPKWSCSYTTGAYTPNRGKLYLQTT